MFFAIRQIFLLALVVAMIASVVLMVRRPVRLLAIIQIVLTALVVIGFAVDMKMALWLHSMAMSNPVRPVWEPRFAVIGPILWFGTIIPWLFFTIFHVIFVARRKLGGLTIGVQRTPR